MGSLRVPIDAFVFSKSKIHSFANAPQEPDESKPKRLWQALVQLDKFTLEELLRKM